MKNLGPKSLKILQALNIYTLQDIRDIGSVAVYQLAKQHDPSVSLNLLWALEGAVLDVDWKIVANQHKKRLLQELGSLK